MIILGVIGVLLFGKRLPDVGRQIGKGLAEFRKGMHGIQTELDSAMNSTASPPLEQDDVDEFYQEPNSPKFEPPDSQ